MAYRLVLNPEAEGDIEEAYNWYEDQKPGLGEELLDELVRSSRLRDLSHQPQSQV